MGRRVVQLAGLTFFLAGPMAAAGAAAPGPIRDNSFLIEEAYNQEAGIVQHISFFSRDRESGSWSYAFTQEWPAGGERHQLSYTLVLERPQDGALGSTGAGDTALNYRLQGIGTEGKFAFAPRLSLLLPTGDEEAGRGTGSCGIQTNLPLSVELGRFLVGHTNAGFTLHTSARNPAGDEARTLSYHAGQSVIWLLRPTFNLMLEGLWSRSEEVTGPGDTVRRRELYLSPGFRLAFNHPSGLQIVPGLAAPFGVGPSRGERSILLYLSFEHPLASAAKERGPDARAARLSRG